MSSRRPEQTGRHVVHRSADGHRHASLVLGFPGTDAIRAYFASDAVASLSARLPAFASAVHAYEVEQALTFVAGGKVLSRYRE